MSIPTNAEIWVIFEQEMDESSIEDNFFVTGPDQDTWSGPDLVMYKDYESIGSESEILQSPDFHGVVQGTFTFEKIKIDSYGSYTGYDYTGNGLSYRTKAIFTPTKALSAETQYTVYLVGDEDITDDVDAGIRTRTVYDTVKGSNLGTGNATFEGGYTGTANDEYNVVITTAGEVGTAEFTYYRDSDLTLVYGPYHTKQADIALSDGVTISFTDGTYLSGDTFSVVVRPPSYFEGNLSWPFETGTGSFQTVPSTTSTTITGSPGSTSTSTDTFSISSTDPEDQESNIDLPDADFTITVTFDGTIDSSTISSSTVSVETEPVNGDPTAATFSGVLPTTLSTSGSDLTIVVASGLLFNNNVVTVTLDETIANTSGTTLDEDYSFYFTMEYTPLYSSVRKLRLDVGAFITNIPDDTINLAIYEASLEADQLTFAEDTGDNDYYTFVRRQWTSCKAAETLLINAYGIGGGLKGKTLGDLSVQYDTKAAQDALNRALGCLAKWTPALNGAGYAVQTADYFVKGDLDPDRPPVGRLWSDNYIDHITTPAANSKSIDSNNSRRWKSGYYSRWGKS